MFHLLQSSRTAVSAMDEVWRNVTWSLKSCYSGLHPTHTPCGRLFTSADGSWWTRAGKPLAGGYYMVIWSVRSDLDFVAKEFRLQSHLSNKCHLCGANSEDKPWTDVRPVAAWRTTIWNDETYSRAHPNRHPLLKLPGVGISAFLGDILHTKHLGSDSYFLGAVIRLLTHHMGGNVEENLVGLNFDLRALYKQHNVRYRLPKLTHNMVQRGDAKVPQLTGPRGLQIRDLVPIIRIIFARRHDATNAQHRDVLRALDASSRIDTLFYRNSRAYRFPEEDHRSVVAAAQTFLECTTALIQFYRSIGNPCFHFTIKYHQLQHLCLQAQYTNPMMGSCYQGEELMQTVRRLLQVSANGASLLTAQSTALQKYSQGLSMMYSL